MSRKGSEDLFILIKTLSKSEKRYFKVFAAQHAVENTVYIALFDALVTQKQYDEKDILKRERSIHPKQFHNLKSYLYKLIRKSLRIYHSSKSIEMELKEMLQDVEIFRNKGLYEQCKKILLKAKKTGYKYEKYLQLLEILNWEKKLLQTQGNTQSSGNGLENLIREEKLVLEKLDIERKHKDIRLAIFQHYSINNVARNKEEAEAYRTITDNNLSAQEDSVLTYDAKRDFYYIKSLYYYAVGDLANCYTHQKKLLDLLESHPEQLREQLIYYTTALGNYSHVCFLTKRYEECSHIIEKMRAIPAKSIRTQIVIFRDSYMRELELYMGTGEFDKGIALIKNIEQGIHFFKRKFPSTYIVVLYFNIAYLYFGTGDYSRSVFWLNKIFNDPSLKGSQINHHCFAQILNLILHFELGNQDLLESIVKSTYRFLYTRNRLYKFENSVLNFVGKKLLKIKTHKELIEAFKELKTELEEIIIDRFEKQALEYFDFISWLESKIENRPFAEIVSEKARKRVNN